MENATKALLIAAAVLIAIIIISLTLTIVQQGSDAVSSANLSEAEIAQFNSKFASYEGSNISTAQANALLETVYNHNIQETNTGDARHVTVKLDYKTGTDNDSYLTKDSTTVTRLTGSKYYKVTCERTNGLVSAVKLAEQ